MNELPRIASSNVFTITLICNPAHQKRVRQVVISSAPYMLEIRAGNDVTPKLTALQYNCLDWPLAVSFIVSSNSL